MANSESWEQFQSGPADIHVYVKTSEDAGNIDVAAKTSIIYFILQIFAPNKSACNLDII